MVKVAVIGAGFMGQTHLARYLNRPDCEVRYLFDASLERAEKVERPVGCKATDCLEEVLNSDIDMVDICLPTFLHAEFCLKAARAGKHVLCEKPMALEPSQCEEMIAACEENRVQLMIAHVIRFWPEYMFVQEANRDGRFGRLLYVRTGRRQALPAWSFQNWMTDPKLSLGGVVDAQIHDLDFATSLFGMPVSVTAVGNKSKQGGWEQATTLMRHANGAVSCAEACNLMAEGYPFTAQMCAVFERASVEFDTSREHTLTVYEAGQKPYCPEFANADAYQNEIDYFVDCIANGKTVEIGTGLDGKNALRLALATKEALDAGKEIML